ncbi:MAG: DUF1579 family protein [Vicinamibacterales bacterium]
MPKPGDAHKKLGALVGEWSGAEMLHPSPWDPAGGAAIAAVTNRWIADGFAVVQDYEQRRDGKVTFSGHGVFWFDPGKQEYVMHWWDSMGGTGGEYRGTFDGNTLILGAPMPQGGHSRTSWVLTGADGHTFLMEVSPDGENWQPAMEGKYRRGAKKSAAKKAAAKKAAAKKAAPQKAAPKKASRAKPAKKAAKRPAKKSTSKPVKKAKKR